MGYVSLHITELLSVQCLQVDDVIPQPRSLGILNPVDFIDSLSNYYVVLGPSLKVISITGVLLYYAKVSPLYNVL